jgi:hypothetical protein
MLLQPPLEFIVMKGHYTEGNLSSAGVTGLLPYICAEGVTVDHVVFQPNSDTFSLTGLYGVTQANETLGPYGTAISLTIPGYWDPFTSSQMQNSSFYFPYEQYFTYRSTSPIAEHMFTSGVYTAAVADEWGDLVLLYFIVD